METSVVSTVSEIDSVDSACPSEKPFEGELDSSEAISDVNSAVSKKSEVVESENNISSSMSSGKILTWEAIAAEVTEEDDNDAQSTTVESQSEVSSTEPQVEVVSSESRVELVEESQPKLVDETQLKSLDEGQPELVIESQAVEESRPESVEEGRPESVEESKAESVEESKPESVEENKPESVEESQTESVEETRLEPVEKDRPEPVEGNLPESVEENQPGSIDECQPDSVEESESESIEKNQAEAETAIKEKETVEVTELEENVPEPKATKSKIETNSPAHQQSSVEKIIEDFSMNDDDEQSDETLTSEKEPIIEEVVDSMTDQPDFINESEIIEITELRPDEAAEIPVEEIHYTVVEGDEAETNEIIEEHLAQTSNDVVTVNSSDPQSAMTIESFEGPQEASEVYVVEKSAEESVDDPSEINQMLNQSPISSPSKPKKPRGRKSISDIPLHVLGRDITKPIEGVSNGGRIMPKPRLGVKVPYRNLTSQIVSKAEIEKEIMERVKIKQEQNMQSPADLLFTRKLTQRLAKKLLPSEKTEATTSMKSEFREQSQHCEIKNNSDLIAILEGNDEEITLPKPTAVESKDSIKRILDPQKEREIALQQLKELPLSPSRVSESQDEPVEEKRSQAASSKTKTSPKQPEIVQKKLQPESTQKKPQSDSVQKKPQPETTQKKPQTDIEPSLKTSVVVKTYTRKRKSFEEESSPPPKKSTISPVTVKSEDNPGNFYVTKSSRVIKPKIIWDPDEIPSKSPRIEPPVKTIEKKTETKAPSVNKEKKEPTVKLTPIKPNEKPVEKKTPVTIKKVVKSALLKKPKRLSEIDRLLMDEGAVNMLYDVQNSDEQDKVKKKNKSVISLDKAHKELMSKTNSIRNDLQQNTSTNIQKVLRKKEVTTPSPKKETPPSKKEASPVVLLEKKKLKDSIRSSVNTPPASPAYNVAEASRIIRRHSSSSFSSNDEMEEETNSVERSTRRKSVSTSEAPKKRFKKNDSKTIKEAAQNNNTVEEPQVNHVDQKVVGKYKTFKAIKTNRLVSIELNQAETKSYLTEQTLKELTACLKSVGNDDDVNVVSITSSDKKTFSNGLDYSVLIIEDETNRKKKATELCTLVKDFLRCLLHFRKVLVAGIQGDCKGLAVTILPLFDMVIASDTTTFSTQYGKLGCVPEAGFLLTTPHTAGHGLANELLLTSQVMKVDEAFKRGLVTRLCWPVKYDEELKSVLSSVEGQSRQSLKATKKQLRSYILQTTESSINSVSKVLIEHWTSEECQKNFQQLKVE